MNRYPDGDDINWTQTYFKAEILAWVCRILAAGGLVIGFVIFAVANAISPSAGTAVVWFLLIAPCVVCAACVLTILYRLFVPAKMTANRRWAAREARKPWPDPTPWKSAHPLDLTPYRVR